MFTSFTSLVYPWWIGGSLVAPHRQHFVRGHEGDGRQEEGHGQRGTGGPEGPKSQRCGPRRNGAWLVNGW